MNIIMKMFGEAMQIKLDNFIEINIFFTHVISYNVMTN